MDDALNLAEWVRQHYPYALQQPMTHLKLQKLCFYGYGTCLALARDVGSLTFEAWKHGPVCRAIYEEYKVYGSAPIPTDVCARPYDARTERVVHDVLAIYGLLDAWSLRQQSHLEDPWKESYERACAIIEDESIRGHFQRKFAGPCVQVPEYLADVGSLRLDRIPVAQFRSLHELADAVRRAQ